MTKNHSASLPAERPERKLSWHDPAVRSVVYQVLALCVVGYLVWFLVSNTMANLEARNIATGFEFVGREAGFAIGESLINYSPADTYGRAILVGIVNTLLLPSSVWCWPPFWARSLVLPGYPVTG